MNLEAGEIYVLLFHKESVSQDIFKKKVGANRRRMLSITDSLSVKSLQVEKDPILKSLHADQSQVFNDEKYDEAFRYNDSQAALRSSLKTLYENGFNVYKGHTESVNSVIFRPNSSIFYSTSSDGRVFQWGLNDKSKTPRTLLQTSVINNLLAISSDGKWLAVATDGLGIYVFNPTRMFPSATPISWGNNRIIAMDFYPDDEHLLFAGSDNNIIKYHIRTGNNQIIAKSEDKIFSLSVAPDGNTIAAGTRGGKIIIWKGENNLVKNILYNEKGDEVHAVQFNHNGTRLASGSLKGNIKIWEGSTGKLIGTLSGHSARVVDIEFSPNNNTIASASFDGTIRLWNAQDLTLQPIILSDHGSWIRSVAFNTRGDRLLSGSFQENRLIAWNLYNSERDALIYSKFLRNSTRDITSITK